MSGRGSDLSLPGFLLLTVVLTWPLAREFDRSLPTVAGMADELLQAYILNWDLKALSTRPLGVFDAPIFHPEPRTLTYMDHLLGEALVAAPIAALSHSPAAAYNAVVIFSFLASAWAMYRLVRLLGVSPAGGFLAGLLFVFSPYRYSNMPNLNLLQTEFIPLALFLALRFGREKRTRDLIGTGVTLAIQSYFSWYYTFYLATALVTLWLYETARGRLRWRELLEGRTFFAAGLAAALILPGLYPYLKQRLTMPGFRRTIGNTALYSADLLDYLKSNADSWLLGWFSGDQAYFPGLVTIALAVLGLRASMRSVSPSKGPEALWAAAKRTARRLGDHGYFLVLGLVGFVLSLGPILSVAGHRLPVPLPYAVLFFVVPGFSSMRAPGRFAVLVLIAAVVLAAMGYESLRRKVAPAQGWTSKALFPATLAAALAAMLSTPLTTVPFPDRRSMPPIYEWLSRQPGRFAILELPVPPREQDEGTRDLKRQIYSLYHGKALVDGVSGFVSPPHRIFRALMQRFPERETIFGAADRGTRMIIVHYGEFGDLVRERLRREAERAPELKAVARYGEDVAYSIVGTGDD